ncbi:MAG: excinuclease ABC subunit UvrA [Alphaproteobacteria bacterium]|nr:excinuclease ABC subunit UvrA [Alphaproteobacteria bacterium]MDY4689004.1 excinuclease ABC subunit UvrA [Alphaproteobacteria bacterium]
MSESKYIEIRGARQHNLKNVDIDIPKNSLTVITGLSGSGKSSLAFDTIYAEGQRRYVESLSSYARQFLDLQNKPDVDSIEGLSPAISIEQKTTSHNPRSTVGTVTEIYDYMRLLWARDGTPYSPATGLPIEAQSVSQMVDKILAMPEGTKLILLAPIARGKKGEFKKEFAELQKKGFQRVNIDDEIYNIEELPELNKNQKHDIEVVVDRIIIKQGIESRVSQSVETALKLSDGLLYAENMADKKRQTFSSKFACPVSGFTIEEIEPRLFSFNNPQGACPCCGGLGASLYMDPELVVPNENLSLSGGAIAPWSVSSHSMFYRQTLDSLCEYLEISNKTPWKDLPAYAQETILYGSGNKCVPMVYSRFVTDKPFEGVIPNMERRFLDTDSAATREELAHYQSAAPCECCHGKRLKPEALAVKICGKDIIEASDMSIKQALNWFSGVEAQLTPQKQEIAHKIIKEIVERLRFLNNVGLDYLTMSRQSGTLSGGEAQRIRLASQIGSGLTGVMYVLDEPSIGLHQRDNDKLLATLTRLRDIGNTVIVVEHDEDAMRAADFLVDMGPGAGSNGGNVVAAGTVAEVLKNKNSLTAQYLTGEKYIAVPSIRRKGNGKFLELTGARTNNLKNVNLKIPLGTFTCVTGISGGGKSSLILETLCKAIDKELNGSRIPTGKYDKLIGLENIDKVIDIDQSPIGRTPRSNPATYTGVFTNIRDWFAGLPEAKARGYTSGRFSFNVAGGRCEACKGDGVMKIEMNFLPDVYVPCDSCHGTRYNRETLQVKFKDKSIADVLDMTIDDAYHFFENIPAIKNKLDLLRRVGLGYIHLGQSAPTLSGGEAQRIKLSKELSKKATGKTLYILDEPTTGLHFEDIKKLLQVLQMLVEQGNTVVVIEHNLDVIKTADYIVDLGPEGGDGGGEIIAAGTPEEIVKVARSYTGKYLKGKL